jgi:hypothetical protein
MHSHELVDHVRSGPAELVLERTIRLRRPTRRRNSCGFNEFLQALQSSETIRDVNCGSQLRLGISEDDWVLLVQTLGRITGIHTLRLHCSSGSRDFHPFQAVADAVNNAHSLRKLHIGIEGETFPKDSSGLTALANAIREHTVLEKFAWFDPYSQLEAEQNIPLDPVLRALAACPHLREVSIWTRCASADAIKNLLQLQSAAELHFVLKMSQWLVVAADEIRRGRCNVQRLTLVMHKVHVTRSETARSEASEAVKAVASAIQMDCNLEYLTLEVSEGFTDEGCVALAEALTVNKTLRKIVLSKAYTLGAQVYEAFSAMLRVNTNLVVELCSFEYPGGGERLLESRKQMMIEQRLNQYGRGRLLASKQTTREEYVDTLYKLSMYGCDEFPAFRLSCVFSLLRLNPSVV